MHYQRVMNPNNGNGKKAKKLKSKTVQLQIKVKTFFTNRASKILLKKLKKSEYLYILSFIHLDQNSKVAVTMYGTN
jgi:hypothetical protein